MKIIAKFHTWKHCGDHDADVCRMIEVRPNETVEELCDRVYKTADERYDRRIFSTLELKLVSED